MSNVALASMLSESMNRLYSLMIFVSSHLIKLVHGLLDTYPGNLVLPIILGGHGLLLQFLGNGGVGWKARKQKGALGCNVGLEMEMKWYRKR